MHWFGEAAPLLTHVPRSSTRPSVPYRNLPTDPTVPNIFYRLPTSNPSLAIRSAHPSSYLPYLLVSPNPSPAFFNTTYSLLLLLMSEISLAGNH
jgi:hypothetical protein